jgi:uncharacterized membrane protein (UPF0127 family)
MIIQIGASDKLIDCFEARTPEEQAQGLKGASHLNPGTGLLFFYEEEALRKFWMPPEMQFPIDIVFIGAGGMVTAVDQDCEPGEIDPSTGELQQFIASAKWVLEIPAGDALRFGITEGVQINFDDEDEEGLV